MKPNFTFSLALFFVGTIILSLNFNFDKKDISVYSKAPERTLLVKYGEEIFRRENCIEYHTLNVKNESEKRISLDGYRGTRTASFIAGLMISPKSFLPGSTMPSFAKLEYNNLNKETLKRISNNSSSHPYDLETAWDNLNKQADQIQNEINTDGIFEHKKSELTALVAFLQFIPPSTEQIKLNTIENERLQKLADEINELYLNAETKILELAQDKKNISRGKELFQNHCSVCHGTNGQGEIGPNLLDEYAFHGNEISDLLEVTINGTDKGMPAYKQVFSPEQIGLIIAYLISENRNEYPNAKAPQGEKQ